VERERRREALSGFGIWDFEKRYMHIYLLGLKMEEVVEEEVEVVDTFHQYRRYQQHLKIH
jgi:hypothetical protein